MHIICSRYNSQTFWGMQWQQIGISLRQKVQISRSGWKLMQLRSTQWAPCLHELSSVSSEPAVIWSGRAESQLPSIDNCLHPVIRREKRSCFHLSFSHIVPLHKTLETRYLSCGFWIELDFLYWLTEIRKAKNVCWLMFSFPFQTLCFVTLCFICKFPLHFFWMGV